MIYLSNFSMIVRISSLYSALSLPGPAGANLQPIVDLNAGSPGAVKKYSTLVRFVSLLQCCYDLIVLEQQLKHFLLLYRIFI